MNGGDVSIRCVEELLCVIEWWLHAWHAPCRERVSDSATRECGVSMPCDRWCDQRCRWVGVETDMGASQQVGLVP